MIFFFYDDDWLHQNENLNIKKSVEVIVKSFTLQCNYLLKGNVEREIKLKLNSKIKNMLLIDSEISKLPHKLLYCFEIE